MSITAEDERCYLCNCAFVDNKVYEPMFADRLDVRSQPQRPLASILALVLNYELLEQDVHSTLLCSTCKVNLLNFEALECQLLELRCEILRTHKRTVQLYDSTGSGIVHKTESSSSTADIAMAASESDEKEEDTLYKLLETEEQAVASVHEAPTDLPYKCASCAQSFRQKRALTAHSKTHLEQKQAKRFTCEHCGKDCGRSDNLRIHLRTHTGERPFKCELCGASFAQRSNLRTHRQTTHFNVAKFECDECGKCFKRRRLLDFHIKSVHLQLRDIQCTQCEASFSHPASYQKHLQSHDGLKPYGCEICGKHFGRRENRNVHRFVHSNKKPYACGVCGEGFMRKAQLLVHMQISQHANDTIVLNQPQFNVANSDKVGQSLAPFANGTKNL